MSTDRVIIVTGASGGIGSAIVNRVAGPGTHIVAHYNSNRAGAEKAITAAQEKGAEAVVATGDLASGADVSALYDTAEKSFGRVDVVVNNAGTATGGPIQYTPEEEFDRVVRTNLRGTFLSCKEAAGRVSDNGRIINVSAHFTADALSMLGAYAATKAGVDALSQSLARQVGERGITVNAVAPGPTDTAMLAPEAREQMDTLIGRAALRRLGTPEDVANVVAYLAGSESGWITGQIIEANGGFA